MKKKSKKIVSILLAVIITVCTAFTFEIDAFANSEGSEAVNSVSGESKNAGNTEISQTPERTTEITAEDPADEGGSMGETGTGSELDPKAEPDAQEPAATDPGTEPDTQEPTTDPGTDPGTQEPPTTDPGTDPGTQEPPTTDPGTKPDTPKPPAVKPAPKVGKVKGLTKTSNETKRITLKWNKVKGAKRYVIYYRNADKTTKYKKYKEVRTNSVTVTGLASNTPYYFKVAAFVMQNGKRYEGAPAVKKTATHPEKVKKLTLKSSEKNITFTWKQTARAKGYKIYRASKSTNWKYVLYKTIKNGKTTSFTDKKPKSGRTYKYQVKAYRSYSATGQTFYGKRSSALRAVSGLGRTSMDKVTSQLWRVSFSWSRVSYADGYDVYYSTSRAGTYKKLGSTRNTFYNSKKLKSGKRYYFKVKPYRWLGSAKKKVYGTSGIVSKKVSSKGYGGKSVGNTYIEVSIKQQHMWMYVDGKLYVETDVVTGNDDGVHNTPRGTYKIWQRMSPTTLVGPGYATPVTYWLAFTYSGCGIHDSDWRGSSEYGGTTYRYDGSHGCVNTPHSKVRKIYNKARIGTYVVVY